MAISFKNVGVLKEIGNAFESENRSNVPIGVKTPLVLDYSSNNIFAMHTSIRKQIADNLRNLLQTNWGERLGLPAYGANLKPLIAEFSSMKNFEQQAIVRINSAVSKWMPFVELIDFDAKADYEDNEVVGKINIQITYAIPTIGVSKDMVMITLFII
jgi:phage baseplate assembly protein W